MFAKGANYIPQDALLTNVTTERYQTLFRDIKEANMNVIRVWGGGTYEDDRFYDLADENGIFDMAGLYVCLHSLSVRSNLPEKSRSRSLLQHSPSSQSCFPGYVVWQQ